MSEVRIPVSLKFDTDTDVYRDLIIELRDNRELSPFIVQLLTFYYEDDEVRDLINYKREENNPFSALKEQITKINMQHTKTIMATNMLASQTQGIISGLEREGLVGEDANLQSQQADDSTFTMAFSETPQQPTQQQIMNQQQQPNGDPSTLDTLMQRMSKVESLLPNINDMLEKILSGGIPQQQQAPVQQQPMAQSVIQPEPQVYQEPVQQQPIITPPTIQLEAQPEAPPIANGQPIAQPIAPPTAQPTAPSAVAEEEERPVKPASFGKALGSLKKKN